MIASHYAGELSCDRGLVLAPDFALKQNVAFLFDLPPVYFEAHPWMHSTQHF